MALGTASGCTNHPGIESVGRCKQCGKPFCSACQVSGPTGKFCSDTCKATNETFIERAQQLDQMSKSGGWLNRFWRIGSKILFFTVVLLVLAVAATYFGVYVPIIGPFIVDLFGW